MKNDSNSLLTQISKFSFFNEILNPNYFNTDNLHFEYQVFDTDLNSLNVKTNNPNIKNTSYRKILKFINYNSRSRVSNIFNETDTMKLDNERKKACLTLIDQIRQKIDLDLYNLIFKIGNNYLYNNMTRWENLKSNIFKFFKKKYNPILYINNSSKLESFLKEIEFNFKYQNKYQHSNIKIILPYDVAAYLYELNNFEINEKHHYENYSPFIVKLGVYNNIDIFCNYYINTNSTECIFLNSPNSTSDFNKFINITFNSNENFTNINVYDEINNPLHNPEKIIQINTAVNISNDLQDNQNNIILKNIVIDYNSNIFKKIYRFLFY